VCAGVRGCVTTFSDFPYVDSDTDTSAADSYCRLKLPFQC